MVVESDHPWYDRIKSTRDHDQFVGRWLHSLDNQDLANPSMAIHNGWQAEHLQNLWYAEELKNDMTIYAFDTRGNGQSPKNGDLHATQLAIDANAIIGNAFAKLDEVAERKGIIPGNKILQGNCIGTMPIAALFAAKLPLAKHIQGTVLLSPVSTFSLPNIMKIAYFLPAWFVGFTVKYLASPLANIITPGEESRDTREEALKRANKVIPEVAVRQTRQVFWKENVGNYWKHVKVPSLLLVSRNDPLVKIEDSYHPFMNLPFPIWYELEAPDHLLLEGNIKLLTKILPKFCNDPWGFYEEHRDLKPDL